MLWKRGALRLKSEMKEAWRVNYEKGGESHDLG